MHFAKETSLKDYSTSFSIERKITRKLILTTERRFDI